MAFDSSLNTVSSIINAAFVEWLFEKHHCMFIIRSPTTRISLLALVLVSIPSSLLASESIKASAKIIIIILKSTLFNTIKVLKFKVFVQQTALVQFIKTSLSSLTNKRNSTTLPYDQSAQVNNSKRVDPQAKVSQLTKEQSKRKQIQKEEKEN